MKATEYWAVFGVGKAKGWSFVDVGYRGEKEVLEDVSLQRRRN